MKTLGLSCMVLAVSLLLAMVVGAFGSSLAVSLLSYGLMFVGVFCFTAGVIRRG